MCANCGIRTRRLWLLYFNFALRTGPRSPKTDCLIAPRDNGGKGDDGNADVEAITILLLVLATNESAYSLQLT